MLDMFSENKMLKENAIADSTTIHILAGAKIAADSQINKLSRKSILLSTKLALKEDEIAIKDRQNKDYKSGEKKQKLLKWIFIILVPVAFEEGYRLHKK